MNIPESAVEAAAKALGVKPCRVDSKNWYSCGGDGDPTEGYSCSDWQCENQDHKGRRACDNPWHRVPAALAAAVPLLCQPLQDEIDRLRAIVETVEKVAMEPCAAGRWLDDGTWQDVIPVGDLIAALSSGGEGA